MLPQRLRAALLVLATLLIFSVGFLAGQRTPTAAAQTGSPQLARLERIWTMLHDEYFQQPLDDEALIQGAIDGMLETLGDRHTSYMPADEFQLLNDSMEGSYTGIGALVEAEGDRLLIVSPFDGSPAKAAGLQPGDQIVQVDDKLVSTFDDPLAAITLVRGPAGEPVTLRIRRDGQEWDVTIVRATIPLISASGELRPDGIGYVRVADFGAVTVEQLRATLTEIMAGEPTGLVLDLRGNPGGSLDAALQVTSEFIGDGTIMIEEWGDGGETSFQASSGGLATNPDLPLVVLVDAGSASASEIVAGAIQDRERGQLLGETTYGKGSVQNWHDLGADDGGVRITIARWLTPDGRWIHEQGLVPDVAVPAVEDEDDPERDFQLESAVKLLLGEPLPTLAPRTGAGPWRCCPGGQ